MGKLIAGLLDWRTTVPGFCILASLAILHWIGADGIHRIAEEVGATGELLSQLTGAFGAIPGVIGGWLLVWNSRKGSQP